MNIAQKQDAELPETVWHYTKMDALDKIFLPKKDKKNPKIRLRFTNCRFLNDPSESMILWKFLQNNADDVTEKYKLPKEDFDEYIEKAKDGFCDYYTLSMSHLKDSFAFWSKEYAEIDGIAIGFDTEKFKRKVEELEDKIECQYTLFENIRYVDYDEPIENIYKDAEVRYENSKIKTLKKAFGSTYSKSDQLTHLLFDFPCIYKFTPWEHEKEVRVILMDGDKERAASKAYHGEENNEEENLNAEEVIVGNKIRKVCHKDFDKDIVKFVMLGPACGDEHVEAVRDYLIKNGYGNIEVSKSKAFDLQYKGLMFQNIGKESSSKKGVSL
jgi:hypothetical protein